MHDSHHVNVNKILRITNNYNKQIMLLQFIHWHGKILLTHFPYRYPIYRIDNTVSNQRVTMGK